MFDLVALIKVAGYFGIGAIIFAESGILLGVGLPGDSLLFTAGILASQGFLNVAVVVMVASICAIAGDNVGYWIGHRFGRSVFSRPGSFFLDPSHITKAEGFFARYGAKTIILARFVPIVRTLAPVLAGVGSMPRRTFFVYNLLGGLVWGAGLPLAGYWLGNVIPNVDHYLLPIILGIVLVSIIPGLYHFLRERKHHGQ